MRHASTLFSERIEPNVLQTRRARSPCVGLIGFNVEYLGHGSTISSSTQTLRSSSSMKTCVEDVELGLESLGHVGKEQWASGSRSTPIEKDWGPATRRAMVKCTELSMHRQEREEDVGCCRSVYWGERTSRPCRCELW